MTNDSTDHFPESAPAADDAGDKSQARDGRASFPIVGVGASAGGLEAFTELLKHLPLDTGMAFVLVQHLDPQHESALTQLLSRATSLPVREVTDNRRVEPDRVYVIPPNASLSIAHGVLKLRARPQAAGAHRSIDAFFESLAQDQRERAIGVILSGTATDGTLGLEAIKAEGGITFAQDDSAKYDSMPRSAVAAGCVDFVLSPKSIAKELTRIAKHPLVAGQLKAPTRSGGERASATAHEGDDTPRASGGRGTPRTGAKPARAEALASRVKAQEDGFKKILLLLRNHSGVDFSRYKSTTIHRRVTRRMVLNKQDTLENYASLLRGNAKELDALYSDALIGVTSFFRNPEAFDVLKRKVFPQLLQQRDAEPLRVWVVGCSTGQEAYSIAMAFVESAEKAARMRKLQVFATHLNDALLDKARHGVYAKSLTHDVSAERLRRFFVEEDGGYRVNKQLRELVVFARQNLISDTPFSHIDLISCRNLLIYLEPSWQKKVFPIFHYALKPKGFLFLGASESTGGFTELFEPVDRKHKHKVYSKKAALTPAFHLPAKRERGAHPSPGRKAPPARAMGKGQREAPEGFRAEIIAQREADRVTVHQLAPPGVLINAALQVLQFRGPTSAYLEPPTGKASFDVLKMAREGLMLPLRAAINRAKKENRTARKENVRVNQNGKTRIVNLEVIPLKHLKERCFLILFEDAGKARRALPSAPLREQPSGAVKARRPTAEKEESRRLAELERELAETRDYLQSIQEQHEAANEELQASNEEVQSANEELQSLNEELETSKEELESANEELTTVNEEMVNRNTELNRLNADLNNLQTSTKLPMVLLGRDLTIRRFTAPAEKIFNLLATDVGRPLGDVRHNLVLRTSAVSRVPQTVDTAQRRGEDPTPTPFPLEALVRDVIDTMREQECEVRDKQGRWYSLRTRPYLTLDNRIDGAVLVLLDIDDLKRAEQAIKAARDYADATLRTARDPLVVVRADMRVNTANEAFYRAFKTTPDQTEGRLVFELSGGALKIPRLRMLLEDILPRNSVFNDFEVTHDFEHIGRRTMLLNARRLDLDDGTPPMILLAIEDVTERQRASEATTQLAAIVQSTEDAVFSRTLDGVITSWNPAAERMFGYSAQEIVGKNISLLIPAAHAADSVRLDENVRRGERVTNLETELVRKSGSIVMVSLSIAPLVGWNGELNGASVIARDITERKKAEERVRVSEIRYRRLFEAAHSGVLILDYVSEKITDANPFMTYLLGYQREELLGKELWQIGLLRDEHSSHAAFQELRQRGAIRYEDLPLQTKSGEKREVEVVANRYEEDRKEVIQCNIRDITERKQAEEALRASEEQFASMFNQTSGGVAQTDLTGRFLLVNERYCQIVGRSREELPTLRMQDITHPEDLTVLAEKFRALVAGSGPNFVIEKRYLRSDGSAVWVHSDVSAIHDAAGNVRYIAAAVADITERKQAEDELRNADRRKNEFLAMLAHELRNPLGPIRNAVELLRHRASDADVVRSTSAMMDRQIRHMVRLVDDLLDASRIGRGSIELRKARVELAAAVNDAVEAIQAYRESRNHSLTVTLPPEPIYLNADATRLSQVVGNLLNNACKFTEKGGTISLTVDREIEHAVIRVRDTGIGIPSDQLQRIFDMFVQGDTSLDRSESGLGIGLALVKSLVELHEGTVEVRSAGLGQGSEFVVRLPIAANTSTAQPESPAME